MHPSPPDGGPPPKRWCQTAGVGLIGGWAADLVLGDPRRFHPVAGFGRIAIALERRMYAPRRGRGALYCCLLVASAAALAKLLASAADRAGLGRCATVAALAWATIGGRSLVNEASKITDLLQRGELEAARARLPALVGRDVDGMNEAEACRAVVESVAENTADAVLGTLLWGALAGPAGMAAFRAANTLDAMVGHRNSRYQDFGWAAARLDDVMAWPAARIGAVLAAACAPLVGGSASIAWRTLCDDGARHPSPNAGRMEAAFAGALGVRLGGQLAYGGRHEMRPVLGGGREPGVHDVARATRLSLAIGATSALLCAGLRVAFGQGAR